MTTLLSAAVRATSGHDDRFLFLSGSQITYLQLFGELVKIFVPLMLLDDMSTAIQGTSEDDDIFFVPLMLLDNMSTAIQGTSEDGGRFVFLSYCRMTCLQLFRERVKTMTDSGSSQAVGSHNYLQLFRERVKTMTDSGSSQAVGSHNYL